MNGWKRFWLHYSDDVGENVAIVVGLLLGLAVCVLVWLGIVGVESYLK